MVAIDATPQSEKVLWSKTLSSVPVFQLTSMRQNNNNQRPNLDRMPFPKRSVFVSPYIVCYWDANAVYGLDPQTGQTLWVRKIPHDNCSILGDDENLFLVFPDAGRVVAIDPASGRELINERIPRGGVFVYGTNIVFLEGSGSEFTLLICDLRDIHDTRRRALLMADSPRGNMPMELLHSRVRSLSMLQTFRNDRFLSVATWETQSLQVYDLLTRESLLPEDNKMLEFVSPENRRTTRCDVQFVGDRILVLFTKEMHLRNTPDPQSDEEGRRVFRQFRQINNVSSVPVDEGVMMLFDSEGNPQWSEPVQIEKMCRLLDVPDSLPVMLFAVATDDREQGANQHRISTRIMGVDKRSGETLFRGRVASEHIPLQPFRVSVDEAAQEIIFTNPQSPQRVVKAIFREE